MTERPILFSAPMVRAILDGRKTQTRRIVKLKPGQQVDERDDGSSWPWTDYDGADMWDWLPCPYGQPGDRLWVRESFMPAPLDTPPSQPTPTSWSIAYAAGGQEEKTAPPGYNPMLYNYERWSPSIHMPRWASRITLEITAVRVERLQEIGEADAQAEGCTGSPLGPAADLLLFRTLWESIHGPESWAANPWVWVVEFRRVTR